MTKHFRQSNYYANSEVIGFSLFSFGAIKMFRLFFPDYQIIVFRYR